MKEFICLDCEHVWHSSSEEPCPECGSSEVDSSGDDTWYDGHFEGDMGNVE